MIKSIKVMGKCDGIVDLFARNMSQANNSKLYMPKRLAHAGGCQVASCAHVCQSLLSL